MHGSILAQVKDHLGLPPDADDERVFLFAYRVYHGKQDPKCLGDSVRWAGWYYQNFYQTDHQVPSWVAGVLAVPKETIQPELRPD